MSALKELLGEKLLKSKNETIDTETAFQGKKAVGIYFSAHWCPPCRMFTPQLGSAYTKDLKDKGLEIVFVSSDRDQGAFDEYFDEQPWLAVPYENRDIKKKLSKKYKVSGIPSFVIIDTDGKTITTDGRSKFSEDPEGNDLPWIPPTLEEIVADATFIDKEGKEMKWDDYRGKPLGLYFSAHWCGPCRGFTPELVKTYETVKGEKGKDFEIIFISSDQDDAAFKDYYKEMPWHALKYDQRKIKSKISDHFDVQGIPTFVMLDENGKLLNADARGSVGSDPKGDEFPWEPKAVGDLQSPDGINDTPSLCLMVDSEKMSEDLRKASIATFKGVVEPMFKEIKEADKEQPYCFFVAESSGGIVDRVRQLCKLGDASEKASVVMVDVPEEGSYKMEGNEITAESIKNFIADYESGKLTKVPFE